MLFIITSISLAPSLQNYSARWRECFSVAVPITISIVVYRQLLPRNTKDEILFDSNSEWKIRSNSSKRWRTCQRVKQTIGFFFFHKTLWQLLFSCFTSTFSNKVHQSGGYKPGSPVNGFTKKHAHYSFRHSNSQHKLQASRVESPTIWSPSVREACRPTASHGETWLFWQKSRVRWKQPRSSRRAKSRTIELLGVDLSDETHR